MTNDIEVIDTTVDATFFVDNHKFTTADVMSGVDNLLEEARAAGEFEDIATAIRSMSGIARVTGWASAKLLHGAFVLWKELGHDPDKFTDYFQDTTHLKPLIIERYILAWEAVSELPQIAEQMVSQPIKNGIALGAALGQGYEPTEEQIEKLGEAKSNSEFLNIIREVKNKPARKSSLTIYLDSDGSLQVWQNNQHEFLGDLDTASDNPIVQKAINRIVDSAGIVRR